MKRLLMTAGLLMGLAAWANAQNGGGNGSSSTASVSSTQPGDALHTRTVRVIKKDKKGRKHVVTQKVPLQEEKNYQWRDGQGATPTGHEATGVNGSGFATTAKDTARRKQ